MLEGTVLHYSITERIGVGAMGEVYRATDTRLDREVALKVLPDDFANDAERIERFKREARILATLNDSGIAAIYGLEDVEGQHLLAMEFVPGDTLQERLDQGTLDIQGALETCHQITEAVEAAHEQGVIHRDLKPDNIKITPDGRIKVLDFGLAKEVASRSGSRSSASGMPRLDLTEDGVVIGTAPYMSPEQVRGRPLDKRTDIWSFGCLLFECLAGRRPFDGPDFVTLMTAITTEEPDWSVLPGRTPRRIVRLLRRCLEKNPHHRLRDIGDARLELALALTNHEWSTDSWRALETAKPGGRLVGLLPWAIAAVAVAVASWQASATNTGTHPAATTLVISTHDLPFRVGTPGSGNLLAISASGTQVVYRVEEHDGLCLKAVGEPGPAEILPSTSGAYEPFFSEDGKWLAYARGTCLRKLELASGREVVLANLLGHCKGGVWTDDGILYSSASNTGLWRIGIDGGEPEVVTTPDRGKGELSHRFPSLLPNGRALLFTIKTRDITTFDDAKIAVLSLDTGKWKVLIDRGSRACYVPTGHLVYSHSGRLLAVPFDVDRLAVTGGPTVVSNDLRTEPTSGAAQYAFSSNGTLVYVPGGPSLADRELWWLDRRGNLTQALPDRLLFVSDLGLELSPDGKCALIGVAGANDSVLLADLERKTLTQLTFEGNSGPAFWSHDGRRALFRSDRRDSRFRIYTKPADSSGEAELLASVVPALASFGDSVDNVVPSPDGRWLAVESAGDIVLLPWNGGDPRPVATNPKLDERLPRISSDGRLILFVSSASGSQDGSVELFVQSLEKDGTRFNLLSLPDTPWQPPTWSPDSNSIHVLRIAEVPPKLIQIPVRKNGRLDPGRPEVVTTVPDPTTLAPHPDGNRFLITRLFRSKKDADVMIRLNWFEDLRRLVRRDK